MEDLYGVDWRHAWIERNRARRTPDGVQYWDGRAQEFSRHANASPYADTFISYLALEPQQRILDVGSGSGTLALPLARAGHEVYAVDFSPEMLAVLERAAAKEGLTNIHTALLDFNAPWEIWERTGITEDAVDVALASRSTMVADLAQAFTKLARAARAKVAVTMATEYGPRGIKRLGERRDGGMPYIPDFIFALNLLLQMGHHPQLRYIDSEKPDEQGQLRLIRWAWLSWDLVPFHQNS
jgi:SAM-dependent methyltransferase